jgi:hypothetical protein
VFFGGMAKCKSGLRRLWRFSINVMAAPEAPKPPEPNLRDLNLRDDHLHLTCTIVVPSQDNLIYIGFPPVFLCLYLITWNSEHLLS